MSRVIENGVRWESLPEFELQLRKLLADAGRIIRKSHAKLITVHQINGITYYKKHYINEGVAARPLKYFFKPSPAKREWRLAQAIEQRGVPVVRHLAFGERWHWNGLAESILITEGFEGKTLVDTPLQQIEDLQWELGRFLRMTHDRGVLQRDLQRNILVKENPCELRRVDVHHAEILPEVNEEQRRNNIALLSATVPLQDAFYRGYGWDSRQTQLTRDRSDAIRRARFYSRSRRCLKRNSEFSVRRFGALRWHVRHKILTEPLAALLTDPDEFLTRCPRLFKGPGRASTVGAGDGYVVKRYNLRKFENLFKDLFRPSHATRTYRKAHHLELLSIPSPRPVATAERRWLHFLRASYFVMEEVPGAIDLGTYLAGRDRPAASLVRHAADMIARLHNEGLSHRDMKETNLLVDESGQLYLIDLDGLSFLTRIAPDRAALDLERLARAVGKYSSVRRADRVAFLLRYCRQRKLRKIPRRTM